MVNIGGCLYFSSLYHANKLILFLSTHQILHTQNLYTKEGKEGGKEKERKREGERERERRERILQIFNYNNPKWFKVERSN